MMTEAFKKEFGYKIHQDVFNALNEMIRSRANDGSVTCGELKFKMNVDHKRNTAFGTCTNHSNSISFAFELTFGKHGEAITYFHNNNAKPKTNSVTQTTTNKKECTCNWSFFHSNNGCRCGAITPYKPKYN